MRVRGFRWLAVGSVVTLMVVYVAAGVLTASASSRSRIKMTTYVGQTAYQRAREQQMKRGPGRKLPSSAFQMKMKVSRRGIEVVQYMDGPCGTFMHHAPGTKSRAWPVRKGRFNHPTGASTGYVRGRVTAKKITGSFSMDGRRKCLTTFTLKRR